MTQASHDDFYSIVNKFEDLYVTTRSKYVIASEGRMYMPKNYDGSPRRLLNETIIAHLNRRFAIAVYSVSIGSKFLCFDVDLPDPSIVFKIISSLEEFGIPRDKVYVSSSGGKGYHVEIFFTDIVYGNMLRDLYDWVVAKEGLDPKKVEFRPTDKQAIKLPLSIHHKTGKVCWYADTTQPPSLPLIEDIEYVMKIERIDRDEFEKMMMEKIVRRKEEKDEGCRRRDMYDVLDAPPPRIPRYILDSGVLPAMTAPGMRHSMMMQIAQNMRAKNVPQEEIAAQLLSWAKEQNPDYITDTWRVVEEDVVNLASWVWSDKYKVPVRKKFFITDNDLANVLHLRPSKMKRKAYFMITLYASKFGSAKLSAARIIKNIGGSQPGVVNALHSLEEAGLISKQKGKIYPLPGGGFGTEPNTYTHHPVSYIEEGNRKTIEVTWDFSPETFNDFYLDTICKYTDHSTWAKYFTTTEIKELQEFERKDSL